MKYDVLKGVYPEIMWRWNLAQGNDQEKNTLPKGKVGQPPILDWTTSTSEKFQRQLDNYLSVLPELDCCASFLCSEVGSGPAFD